MVPSLARVQWTPRHGALSVGFSFRQHKSGAERTTLVCGRPRRWRQRRRRRADQQSGTLIGRESALETPFGDGGTAGGHEKNADRRQARKIDWHPCHKSLLASVEVGPTPGEKSAPPSTAAATQGGEQRVIASSSEVVKLSRNCNALCTQRALFRWRFLHLGEDFFHAARQSFGQPRRSLEAGRTASGHPSPESGGMDSSAIAERFVRDAEPVNLSLDTFSVWSERLCPRASHRWFLHCSGRVASVIVKGGGNLRQRIIATTGGRRRGSGGRPQGGTPHRTGLLIVPSSIARS